MSPLLAVLSREYLIRRTSPMWLFFDMMLPLLYMVMFGVALDKAIGTGLETTGMSVRYNEFFLAGVLSMSCFGSAINQSYGFFVDRDNGILFEFLTYPMTRGQFLLGKILFQCLMSIVQCLLALLAGVVVLDIQLRFELVWLVFLGVMMGTAGWFFFLAIFAFLIRRNDTYNTVINVGYFVLMFMSSLFYPLDNVPAWLRVASQFNPLTWHTDVLRYLTIGVGDPVSSVVQATLFLVFLVGSFWFALKALQKVV
jgi:ABC-2 type transport system permease protein